MSLLRSMRVRLALSFAVLLVVFGWILSRAISHSTLLQMHYAGAGEQHHIRVALWLFMAILFPLVAIGAWALVARTLRPLRSLSKQASEASAESRLVSPSSDTEMAELVATLNGLLERIELTSEAKANFYAAASHELRTPLQALSGHLETALSQERSAEEYRVALVEAQLQSSRLSRLTRDILLLHQLQAPGGLSDERADLSDSVGTALAELGALLEARQLSVSGDFPQGIEVPGRQTYADAAVRNLIENAARYTTKGGCIQIQLAMGCFTIANDCVFPPDVNLESFFEPFGRSDPSRNSSSGGNGLGLAVCRAIANANGWSVSLARTDTGILAKIDFSR